MVLFSLVFSLFSSLPGLNGKLQLQTDDCQSGIYCRRREQNLQICPAGFFCPEGSITPVPCPPGTFRSEGAALGSQSCLTCPVDFFNPRPGQAACFPCGSEAVQPAEGQETCICLGKNLVFQPRDAHCTCPPGYWRSSGDGRPCVRQAYEVCRDSASRNQEGQCLTKKGWVHYCSEKVCSAPSDYQGYDKALGLCICQTDSLESVCNSQCRRQQRDILQVTCTEQNAQLVITHRNGSKTAVFLEDLRTVLLIPYFSLKDICTSEQSKHTYPTYLVKMSGKGFLGVYNPDPQLFHNFIMLNEASSHHRNKPSAATAPVKSGPEESRSAWGQNQGPPNSTSHFLFTGILNPTTCINVNVTLMFIVSKEHYPVYDVNNLYNTNAEFDWGDLRNLRDEVRETSQEFLFFLFQLQTPGTYVLRLSSNQHKKMYIRVMPAGGQCYEEGPFFPTTPRYAVQVGIAKKQDLILKPDWTAITGVITGLLILLIASVALIISLGRNEIISDMVIFAFMSDQTCLKIETTQLLCPRLSWSQQGTACPPFRRQQLKYNLDSYSSSGSALLSLKKHHPSRQDKACFLQRDDVWEPEDQIDLEAFNTNVFFELLLRQSLSVTAKLGHFKEEVKTMYHKVTSEVSSLKNLWIKTLNIPKEMKSYNSSVTEAYLTAKKQAEEEMQQRKQLAAEYEESVKKEMDLLQQALKCQEEHYGMFSSALREGLRLAEMVANEGTCKGNPSMLCQPGCTRLLAQLEAASSKMRRMIQKESHHLKAWGVLGEGLGPHLLDKAKPKTLTKEELMGKPEVPILPCIPYPFCPSTGLPVKTKLPVLCPEKMFGMGGLMLDPVTELEVPVLAVTIHPHTGQQLAVGGTYLNPLTGMLTPLEIGAPMAEPEGGKIVPILGVGLDATTGEVVPLGGLVGPSGNLMLLGDSFTKALSGKIARAEGAQLQQDEVLPHTGIFQAVLEAEWLLSQTQVVDALQHFKASVLEEPHLVADRLAALKASMEDMKKAFRTGLYHALHRLQSLERKQGLASRLRKTGGKLGMIKYPGTEMWIPAVFGMKIPDPSGSSLMVPILGIDWDCSTRQPSPLAGTMEDRNGKGLIPITIGARTISPITGETGPVIGAQINPWTHNVIPTVQSLGALPRRVPDPDLVITDSENPHYLQLDFLEKEITSRNIYWHSRRKREEELLKKLNSLFLHVLDAAKEGKIWQVKIKEKVKDLEEMCRLLKGFSLQEAEKQNSKHFTSQLATELSMLSKADRNEKEQEIQVLLEIRKALEKLMEFTGKMQAEEERRQMQLMEREKQRGHIPGTETATNPKLRKVILASEAQEFILNQQARVEAAYSKLEYLRDSSTIQMQQAKMLFSGSQCFENYETGRFYGISGISASTCKVIQQNLIPLLKSTVQMLQENSKSSVSPETSERASRAQDALMAQEGELAVVDPASLPSREFVTYQYGISVLQLLRLHVGAPEIDLGVASSIPPSNTPGNAFRNHFFYQNSKNKLFVLRDCLSSAGSFLLLLVHCLAHITAADFSHDTNPLFLGLFYQALKTCLSEMFSLRLQLSAALQGDKPSWISQTLLKEEPLSPEEINLISQLFEVQVKRLTDTEAFEKMKSNFFLHTKAKEQLKDKLKKAEHPLHASTSSAKDTFGWRTREEPFDKSTEEETCTSSFPSELEDKVDALTEELVHIIEDEHQVLSSKGNEDLLSYYLEITGLEKDRLVKQINALKDKIALGRKL